MIYCTSYESPDLDGVACSIAYAEYLNLSGKKAVSVYFGELGLETKFFIHEFGNLPIKPKVGGYESADEIVLLDTADPDAIDPEIPTNSVVQIFDHRKLVFIEKFSKAKTQIELVGSCATLVTEKFMPSTFTPPSLASTLLYGAIISNTINFKNKVTTDRDRTAADWLRARIDLPNDFVKQMFAYKSQVKSGNLHQVLEQEFAIKEMGGKKIGITQLEITDLEKLINENHNLITDFLNKSKVNGQLDFILFTGIDIYEGFNILITADSESDKFFSNVLGLDHIGEGLKTKEIIMRKEIWPKIK